MILRDVCLDVLDEIVVGLGRPDTSFPHGQ